MKFVIRNINFILSNVAPSHEGAWIEIMAFDGFGVDLVVAPSHEGAWIEIKCFASPRLVLSSPPHTRGRGLKFEFLARFDRGPGKSPPHTRGRGLKLKALTIPHP